MTEILKLEGTERNNAGTGASRALRRSGHLPAIIYGEKKEGVKVSLPLNTFHVEHQKGGMKTRLLEVSLGGKSIMTLPKDIQLDPVTDLPIHVDLFRIGKDSVIEIAIAVRILNEEKSVGVKKGGVINMAHREILLKCHPTNIPQNIEIDVSELDMGQSVHLSDIALPKGVEAAESPETTVLSLVGRAEEVEETASEEGAEGESAAEEAK